MAGKLLLRLRCSAMPLWICIWSDRGLKLFGDSWSSECTGCLAPFQRPCGLDFRAWLRDKNWTVGCLVSKGRFKAGSAGGKDWYIPSGSLRDAVLTQSSMVL